MKSIPEFAAERRDVGYSEKEINKMLLENGYDPEEVKEYFREIRVNKLKSFSLKSVFTIVAIIVGSILLGTLNFLREETSVHPLIILAIIISILFLIDKIGNFNNKS